MSAPNGEREYVIRTARENDVKFIRLWFTDILGNLKGFAINIDDLDDAIDRGVGSVSYTPLTLPTILLV